MSSAPSGYRNTLHQRIFRQVDAYIGLQIYLIPEIIFRRLSQSYMMSLPYESSATLRHPFTSSFRALKE